MKTDMKTKLLILITFIFLITLGACIKDNFNFDNLDTELEHGASFAFPAVWGDVAFTDAINLFDEDGYLIINEDDFVSLVYRTRVRSDDVHDIIFLPDQSASGQIEAPDLNMGGFNQGDVIDYSYSFEMEFDVFNDEAELKSVLLKSGLFEVTAQSTFQHTTRLNVQFPSITKNGQTFEHEITFAPGGETVTNNIDFQGYDIDLSQTSQGYNEIPIDVNIIIWHSGSDDNSGDLSFNLEMTNMQYEVVTGYFGINTLIFESDTLDITLFRSDDFEIEDYRFVDPKFKINYWNSYGVPSSFYFSHLTVNSALDGLNYNIIHYGDGIPMDSINPYHVSYSTVIGATVEDSLQVSKENSNIDEILDMRPQWLQFVAHAHTNPLGVDHDNFVTSESLLEAEVLIELPLWGYIYNFNLRDTVELDISEIYEQWHPISRALLRIELQNGFPVEAFSQLYFVDSDYNVLDKLFHTDEARLLKAAKVDPHGRVVDFERQVTKIEFDLDRLEKVKNTQHIVFEAYANSTAASNEEVVKIYDDYRIKFDIGFEVDVDIEIDLDTIN